MPADVLCIDNNKNHTRAEVFLALSLSNLPLLANAQHTALALVMQALVAVTTQKGVTEQVHLRIALDPAVSPAAAVYLTVFRSWELIPTGGNSGAEQGCCEVLTRVAGHHTASTTVKGGKLKLITIVHRCLEQA
eukprot:353950-Chlamydomonas_euryale.AAC.9